MNEPNRAAHTDIEIAMASAVLRGILCLPRGAHSLVMFAHGSGSGRLSPRNAYVSRRLSDRGLGTLLFDLLTEDEERIDSRTAELRFDISLLADRLQQASRWVLQQPALRELRLGYFGASTGAAAALVASTQVPQIQAIVSRGGRPDLAGAALLHVRAATLLIVGGYDEEVLTLNRGALAQLRCEARLEVVPGATHLFEERGALAEVASLAVAWFLRHLPGPAHCDSVKP